MPQRCIFIYVGQRSYAYTLAARRDYRVKREPQIGFAYLSAVLRQHDVEPEIIDFTINPYSKKCLVEYVTRTSPIFVGFYASVTLKENVIEYLRDLRHAFPNLKILVGGPDVYDYKSYLDAGADAYCVGEGERTIVELLSYCRGHMDRPDIKGIAYKQNGRIVRTAPREIIEDLDELPIPAWDKFALSNYYDYHVFDMSTPYTSIMASRGCPFKCSFCISHIIWRYKHRRRSPEHVMRELDFLVSEHGVKYIMFQDDIWAWNDDEFARAICKELRKREYNLKWRCILHPLSFRKNREEMLSMMKQAGCTSITTGLQSASEKILRNINRSPREPEALADLIGVMKKVGILNSTAFIFGLPGETEETIEESVQYALKIKPTFCAFYELMVLPGSGIWRLQKEGEFHSLTRNIIKKKCKEASRRFYTNPVVLWNILDSILETNPKWLFWAFGSLNYFLEISGLFRAKDRGLEWTL